MSAITHAEACARLGLSRDAVRGMMADVLAGTRRALRRADPTLAPRHPVAAGCAGLWALPGRCALRVWVAAVAGALVGGIAGVALWWAS